MLVMRNTPCYTDKAGDRRDSSGEFYLRILLSALFHTTRPSHGTDWQTMWLASPIIPVSLLCAFMSAAIGARLRLSNGTYGRVELYYSSSWGTICDDNWRINEGNVVCRELGFVRAEAIKVRAEYGQGSGYIHYFVCGGTESSLDNCSTRQYRISFCNHSQDVGVICWRSGTEKCLIYQ